MSVFEGLPNEKHILKVWGHCAQHPDKWRATSKTLAEALVASGHSHWYEANLRAGKLNRGSAISASLRLTDNSFAQWAMAALAVWDDCAYIIDLPPDAVKLLAACENPAAVLLYPAVLAMYEGDNDGSECARTERERP